MAGNWKMNLTTRKRVVLVQKLAWTLSDKRHDFGAVEVVVVPPFTDLRSVQTLVDGDRLSLGYGAQDVSVHDSGAYTGEISAGMLAKLGCSYVVVGHSERRMYHRRATSWSTPRPTKTLQAGMTPIVCVGEGLDVRQAGEHVSLHPDAGRRLLDGFTASRWPARGGLRAGLGDRHGRGRHPGRRGRRSARRSASGVREGAR